MATKDGSYLLISPLVVQCNLWLLLNILTREWNGHLGSLYRGTDIVLSDKGQNVLFFLHFRYFIIVDEKRKSIRVEQIPGIWFVMITKQTVLLLVAKVIAAAESFVALSAEHFGFSKGAFEAELAVYVLVL